MASRMPFRLSSVRFRKKLTVIGMMGQTQGVSKAMSPPRMPSRKDPPQPSLAGREELPSSKAFNSETTGDHKDPSKSPLKGETSFVESSTEGVTAMDAVSLAITGSVVTLSSPFKGELERVFSPLKLNSTSVGGMQFSSLQAP